MSALKEITCQVELNQWIHLLLHPLTCECLPLGMRCSPEWDERVCCSRSLAFASFPLAFKFFQMFILLFKQHVNICRYNIHMQLTAVLLLVSVLMLTWGSFILRGQRSLPLVADLWNHLLPKASCSHYSLDYDLSLCVLTELLILLISFVLLW